MGLTLIEVKRMLQEVGLDIKLKQPKSTSTRWDVYTIHALDDSSELAVLRHTEGQGLGNQFYIDEGEGINQTLFSDEVRAVFKKITDNNPK